MYPQHRIVWMCCLWDLTWVTWQIRSRCEADKRQYKTSRSLHGFPNFILYPTVVVIYHPFDKYVWALIVLGVKGMDQRPVPWPNSNNLNGWGQQNHQHYAWIWFGPVCRTIITNQILSSCGVTDSLAAVYLQKYWNVFTKLKQCKSTTGPKSVIPGRKCMVPGAEIHRTMLQ